MDDVMLRCALLGSNVTAPATLAASEVSRGHEDWRNGAFTEVVIEALGELTE